MHNLKNITVEIPRDKLIVVTGLSGSGKSSLAFDTIYAEGQRRYMESLSSFAKRFIAQVSKPDVDFVFGLSPVISITASKPRSPSSRRRKQRELAMSGKARRSASAESPAGSSGAIAATARRARQTLAWKPGSTA